MSVVYNMMYFILFLVFHQTEKMLETDEIVSICLPTNDTCVLWILFLVLTVGFGHTVQFNAF